MLDTVLSVLDGLDEPAEFVSALRNLPPASDGILANRLAMSTPAENLAATIFLYRILTSKNIGEASYECGFSNLSRIIN